MTWNDRADAVIHGIEAAEEVFPDGLADNADRCAGVQLTAAEGSPPLKSAASQGQVLVARSCYRRRPVFVAVHGGGGLAAHGHHRQDRSDLFGRVVGFLITEV